MLPIRFKFSTVWLTY